ncbi:unnamed protein product [Penicillium salamii]|nr:unnamed protein product [Penicillium salamii]
MDSFSPMSRIYARAGIEPGSRQASVFGVGISFIAFISTVMGLRMYVRVKLIRAVGVDDTAHYGTGKHIGDIRPEDFVPMTKSIYSTRLLYVVALFFVKTSLLWFYLRLDKRGYMRWAVYALVCIVAGLSISSFFVLAFSCSPPSKFWDLQGTAPGHCMAPDKQQTFYEVNGVLNIVTDIFIYITPIPMLWHVQINLRKKMALVVIFGLGVLSIAAGCVRYDYVRMLATTSDQFYALADALNWCSIEAYVAIFCGSAPALSVILKACIPRIFGSSNGDNRYQSSSAERGLRKIMTRPRNPWSTRGGPDPMVSVGSLDHAVPDGTIVLRTEVHMEVESGKLKDDHSRDMKGSP